MKLKPMNIAVWALSVVGLGLIAPVSKAENHTMSGALCVPSTNTSGTFGYSQYGVHRADVFDPRGAPDGVVTCPLVFNNAPGKVISALEMTVYDRSNTENISCTLVVTNLNGDATFTSTRGTNTLAQSGPITFNWFTVSGGSTGLYGVINCHLPYLVPSLNMGYSHIATYSIG